MKLKIPNLIGIVLIILTINQSDADEHVVTKKSLTDHQWNEGFFKLDQLNMAERHGFSIDIIQRSAQWTGVLAHRVSTRLTPSKATTIRDKQCGKENVRIWFQKECQDIDTYLKDDTTHKSAVISVLRHFCSGIIVRQGYFITAKHCIDNINDKTLVRLWSSTEKKPINHRVETTRYTHHNYPYDIAILKIQKWPESATGISVSTDYEDFDPVFSIGFPNTHLREKGFVDYEPAYGDMRMSFGNITHANRKEESFCKFSNDIVSAQPSTWKLEPSCSTQKKFIAINSKGKGYIARREHNPMLVNIDMISGMSGAPLFNKKGELIGIGSTVMKDNPPLDYSPEFNAVYVKSRSLIPLLNAL